MGQKTAKKQFSKVLNHFSHISNLYVGNQENLRPENPN